MVAKLTARQKAWQRMPVDEVHSFDGLDNEAVFSVYDCKQIVRAVEGVWSARLLAAEVRAAELEEALEVNRDSKAVAAALREHRWARDREDGRAEGAIADAKGEIVAAVAAAVAHADALDTRHADEHLDRAVEAHDRRDRAAQRALGSLDAEIAVAKARRKRRRG